MPKRPVPSENSEELQSSVALERREFLKKTLNKIENISHPEQCLTKAVVLINSYYQAKAMEKDTVYYEPPKKIARS